MNSYADFIATKLTRVPPTGLHEVPPLAPSLFPFQRDLVTWALRRGRAAIFAGTGLGKSRMQIEWARHVAAHTGKPALILAPLAVAAQTAREGAALGVDVRVCRDGSEIGDAGIFVTNYERLHRFDPSIFGGVVCDESSILKNFNSKTLRQLLDAFGRTPFRLCATATPSPNDYTELGTHAEFLGICTRAEMLAEYFCHDGGETQVWRLKGHARDAYWRWVSSWGALIRQPSDLGYDDAGYALPTLRVTKHTIATDADVVKASGLLFAEEARTLSERRNARRGSLDARVKACAEIVNADRQPWIVWCDLNVESEALTRTIPDAVEVRGSDDSEVKEERLVAFGEGRARVIVTKPSIAGFGLNWQHAARQAFVGVTDSWESYYQAVRRSWRFGQTREVHVHIFASELEGAVIANLERKECDAQRMADELSAETREALRAEVHGARRETNDYRPAPIRMPAWLRTEEESAA